MKIVELLASRHFTGPAERVLQTMRLLSARGHEVAFAHTRMPPGTLETHTVDAPFRVLTEVRLARRGLAFPGVLADAARLAEWSGRDTLVCHAHTSHDHWTGLMFRRRAAGRVVLVRSVHESRQAGRRIGDHPLFAACDGVIAISQSMRERLIEAYRLDPERCVVIPGAVDTHAFRPGLATDAIRAEIGARAGDTLAGIVSRIKPGRGHRLLVEAFGDVAREVPSARLLIVGRGEGKAELEAFAATLPCRDRVHFLGYRRDDLANIYNALDVSVLLGEGSDGTCRAALEAMACGTPVIAARVGSLPETIDDGATGALVDEGDAQAVARALVRYLANPELAAAHGRAARGCAERDFALDAMALAHEAFFARLVEAGS